MGELSAQTLTARGVLGYVVDGGSRDTDLVLEQKFPVFCSFLTPSDIVRALDSRPLWRARHDRRRHHLDRRLPAGRPRRRRDHAARARSRRSSPRPRRSSPTESDMRRALIGGMDPVEAYNQYGKF